MAKLGYLPLAIQQAGAYISARQLSLNEYLPKYQKGFEAVMKKRSRCPDNYGHTVYTTWQMSFDAVKKESNNAAQLLITYGFLSNDVSDALILYGESVKDKGGFGKVIYVSKTDHM